MSNDKTSPQKRKDDRDLTEELKQSFPASDPPTVTRQPTDQRHVKSEEAEADEKNEKKKQ
ncbi:MULTISPECIES: hypothetical protein [unclassified Beijerinckia]|uniref:hypothetical protein n=1 Tax=unclassified Beijerinckia TaxID=2638183 RepID=UPI0008965356|nr:MULTISPECIES: hypothetical protein [unclassified Beijerinckia]MDH7797254.1 hypothetical protein [Beijerinckia sp. GAS462]SEC78184.1 hypothetical protein SAMN05443249_3546 [Beijerinckia sp. 28-YEA-48]